MTTNATLLAPMAEDLYKAGIHRINISLDTLDAKKYEDMTRGGKLSDALEGLRAAMYAGMRPVKLNAVLIGGFNDTEIETLAELTQAYPVELRFIELMPIGHTSCFPKSAYIPDSVVLQKLPGLEPVESAPHSVARLYKLPHAQGRIGLLSPLSNHFCAECNRVRLTADGRVKPCLHSNAEYPLKGLDFSGMRAQLEKAIWEKPRWHGSLDAAHHSGAGRNMNQIGG